MAITGEKVVVSEKTHIGEFFTQPKGNYYPFGKEARGSSTSNEPKEQFSGKPFDDEIGLNYFGSRYFNPDVGRFISSDRYSFKYPAMTPYQYAANNPVLFIDVNGDSIRINYQTGFWSFLGLGKKHTATYRDGKAYNQDGTEYTGDNKFVNKTVEALNKIGSGEEGAKLVGELESNTQDVNIKEGTNDFKGKGMSRTVSWNPNNLNSALNTEGSTYRPSFIGLAHELGHAYDMVKGTWDENIWFKIGKEKILNAEKNASLMENKIRAEHSIPLREFYAMQGKKGYEPSRLLVPATKK